ncbi:glycosyltransferase [Mucilaginibacter sp.]|uniref:glycosyltransferase n=1 Tax=Mucilaginibacter sp. TaxID=1882438 RepID=UPI003AFFFC6A
MKNRIAFISEHASPLATLGGVDSGGQNVYVGELAKHIAQSGYEVDIFTRRDDVRFPEIVSWVQGVRVIHVTAGPETFVVKEDLLQYMPDFTAEMIAFIAREKIDYALVHANFWMSGLVACNLKKQLKLPFVITYHALGHVRRIHQGEQDKFPKERILIEEEIARQADQIVAECPQDQEDLINYYNADPENITIIPCGFCPTEFYPIDKKLARMILNLETNENIILQLGRMVPRKGIDNVIRALVKVKKTDTPLRLVVVGGESDNPESDQNPEMLRLKKLAADHGVTADVTFVGRKNRDILKYYYAAADIFITTPWYEPFGITPLEAMACGTPVVGANVGGIKHSIADGKTGFLVPPNNPDALAQKIFELISNKKLLNDMRDNAIRRVNALFTWHKISEMAISMYEKIIHGNNLLSEEDNQLTLIDQAFDKAADTFMRAKRALRIPVAKAATLISNALATDKKLLVCGNGGSAAGSLHFTSEMMGYFESSDRQGLPVISLAADTSVVTGFANDSGFDDVFSRQIETYGKKGDILLCLSTSGQSVNIVNAIKVAHKKQMTCIALLGKGGGDAATYAHLNIIVPSNNQHRIQEVHLHLLHTVSRLVENNLFSRKTKNIAVKKPVSIKQH